MTAVLLPVAARCAVQKFGEFLPETVEIVHPVVVIASIAAAAVVAAVVVTSVTVLVGTTGRLFVGGTIVLRGSSSEEQPQRGSLSGICVAPVSNVCL